MKNDRITPYLLLLPAMLLLVLLYAYPILITIIQSFSKVNLLTNQSEFIGLANYRQAFLDPGFYSTFALTFKYTAVTVFLKMGLGFLYAALLSADLYFKKPLRFLLLLPWAIPQVAVGTFWQWILDGNYGYLNYFLMTLNIIKEPIAFLSNPDTAFYSVAFVDAWVGIPLISLTLISGFEAIPRNLYEAADIDGASKFRQFFDITIPGIRKVFISILTLVTIWTFNSFNIIYVLTQGGPMRATETVIIRIYQEAFSRFDFGMSATLTVMAVGILTVLTLFYMRGGREKQHE